MFVLFKLLVKLFFFFNKVVNRKKTTKNDFHGF